MQATIYVLKDPRTSEIRYVGCTRNIQQRFKAHLNKARDLSTEKRKWLTELRELGLKPILEELETIDEQLSIAKEKEYIKKFRLLNYNLVNTGDLTSNGNITSFSGQNSVKVVALMLDGTFYNSYPSIQTASNMLNISSSNIWSVLSNITKTAGKLLWVYEDDYYDLSDEDIEALIINAKDMSTKGGKDTQFKTGEPRWNSGLTGYKTSKRKPVIQRDAITKEILAEYESCKEAGEAVGCKMENIRRVCVGLAKTAKGYDWDYK